MENQRKETASAEADIKKAIEVAPASPAGDVAFAKLRISQNKPEDAEKYFQQALTKDPNQLDSIRGLVEIFMKKKQPEKATALVSAHLQQSPNNDALYTLQGVLQANLKKFPDAEASLQKATQLNPSNTSAFLMLAQVQASQGATDRAVTTAYNLIQQNPQNVQGYVLAGDLENSRNNFQKAQDLYQKALQIQPDYAPAANDLAYLMLERGGNTDVALSLAQTARRAMPDSPMTADTLAWAYYYKGTYEFARDLLEDAAKADPGNATIQYHLGMVYRKLSDKTSAVAHLKKAVSLARDPAVAKDAKAALQGLG